MPDVVPGDLFERVWRHMTGYFIHHDIADRQLSSSLVAGDNTWIEVRHEVGGDSGEYHTMWFTYAPGSGIWFNTGRTAHFRTYETAARDVCDVPRPSCWEEEASFANCVR